MTLLRINCLDGQNVGGNKVPQNEYCWLRDFCSIFHDREGKHRPRVGHIPSYSKTKSLLLDFILKGYFRTGVFVALAIPPVGNSLVYSELTFSKS